MKSQVRWSVLGISLASVIFAGACGQILGYEEAYKQRDPIAGTGGNGAGGKVSAETPELDCNPPLPIPGNCKAFVCNDKGEAIEINDDTDPQDDGDSCTIDTCQMGQPHTEKAQAGSPCGSGGKQTCGANGKCSCAVESDCVFLDAPCKKGTCGPDGCVATPIDAGKPCGDNMACDDKGTCKAANGTACVTGDNCASNHCVEGVCCDSVCGDGSTTDCQSCKVAGAVGTCKPIAAGEPCRKPAGLCDVAEVCNGSSLECPADALQPSSFVCRDAPAGSCDAVEKCDGVNPACPVDAKLPAGAQCNPASCSGNTLNNADTCDAAGKCIDGGMQTCSGACYIDKCVFCAPGSEDPNPCLFPANENCECPTCNARPTTVEATASHSIISNAANIAPVCKCDGIRTCKPDGSGWGFCHNKCP